MIISSYRMRLGIENHKYIMILKTIYWFNSQIIDKLSDYGFVNFKHK